MTMPFEVREPKELEGVVPGMTVEFTLVLEPDGAYVEQVRIRRYEATEQDPLAARAPGAPEGNDAAVTPPSPVVEIGETVPDFTLIDQARQPVTLSALRGKVVALNFIYTNCALPQFCFRLANHFGSIQRRFGALMGKDLILLTVTFDPARDQPERLAEYAKQWNADSSSWHFLTGAVPDVRRVCSLFGVQAFRDDGLMNHSSRTAVIDRQGRLDRQHRGQPVHDRSARRPGGNGDQAAVGCTLVGVVRPDGGSCRARRRESALAPGRRRAFAFGSEQRPRTVCAGDRAAQEGARAGVRVQGSEWPRVSGVKWSPMKRDKLFD